MYLFAFPPSMFYTHVLPRVKTEQDAIATLEVLNYQILALKSQLDFMKLNDIFYPKHFTQLKHEIKQLQIFVIDVENEVSTLTV